MIRRFIYIFCLILVIIVSRIIGITKLQLGLTTKNWGKSAKQIVIPTLMACLGLIGLHAFFPSIFDFSIRYPTKLLVLQKSLFYILLSVPIQEIIHRGYFITRLEQITNNRNLLILFSALFFAIAHVSFGALFITLGSFLIGVVFADNFLRFRNLYVLMLSHLIIGLFLIYFINA